MTVRDEIEYQPIDIKNVQYKNDGEDIAIYNRYTKYSINEKAENFTDPSERQDSVVIGEKNTKFDFDLF